MSHSRVAQSVTKNFAPVYLMLRTAFVSNNKLLSLPHKEALVTAIVEQQEAGTTEGQRLPPEASTHLHLPISVKL